MKNGAFELLGTTETDLSNYYNKTELDKALSEAISGTTITDWDDIIIS